MIVKSQCFVCQRLREVKVRVNGIEPVVHARCEAYPNGVPEKIATNRVSHMREVETDKGLRFLPSKEVTPEELAFHTEIRPGT